MRTLPSPALFAFLFLVGLGMSYPTFAEGVAVTDPPVQQSFLDRFSFSGEADTGYLLPEPHYLVTDKAVAQFNALLPLVWGCYADGWISTVASDPGFKQAGDEIDGTLGCLKALSEHDTVDAKVSIYAIAGSHNDRYVLRVRYTHDFGNFSGYAGVETHAVEDGSKTLQFHLGADHSFTLLGHTWSHSPQLTTNSGGPFVFSDSLSVSMKTAGVVWAPHVVVSVPDHGPSYAIFGIGFNF